ncbi:MAG: hypothetical protein FD153_1902 [Rhodospirillaceae bacterium]|nr:MAG: hypothetical protein FD153_1902 [Rhodospirillaceae bacterium]
MSEVCRSLRAFCIRNESAANVFAFLGAAGFLVAIWVAIYFQSGILHWVYRNPLLHGLILGGGTLAGSLVIFSLLCLGFSEHTHEHKTCTHAYRGRGKGKPLFPWLYQTISHLGANPRWRVPRH